MAPRMARIHTIRAIHHRNDTLADPRPHTYRPAQEKSLDKPGQRSD
jgi:hypothetical protein